MYDSKFSPEYCSVVSKDIERKGIADIMFIDQEYLIMKTLYVVLVSMFNECLFKLWERLANVCEYEEENMNICDISTLRPQNY